jgi:hypothetical protein
MSAGRVVGALTALAAVATILTFIFTYVIGHHGGGGQGGGGGGGATTPSLTTYPAAAQQNWLSSCEGNQDSASTCQCDLSYFEQHASYQQFEQYSGAIMPGVVPVQLDHAIEVCGP